jgi:hypothetical protein
MNDNQEQLHNNPERGIESSESAKEQLEKIEGQQESAVELSPRDIESKAEKARVEALENAVSIETGGKKAEKIKNEPTIKRRGPISKKQREVSYKQTMQQVQQDMNNTSRTFSKIIHSKTIEKTSEVVGGTIARPNAILFGSFFAFIFTLIAYIIAKNFGYSLSGFETIAAFIFGWLIGILYDYFKVLFTGKKD